MEKGDVGWGQSRDVGVRREFESVDVFNAQVVGAKETEVWIISGWWWWWRRRRGWRWKRRTVTRGGDNNDIVVANFLGQGRRTGVEEMELKMYSKTIIIGEEGNNDNSIYSSKKVVDVFDRVDFNAVTALVGKKTLQSGHHVPAWIKSAGCEYLAHCARKKEDFVLLAKACTDKRHWSVRLAALKAFAKLGFHSRPYYTQLILFNAHDEICEIREQLCETLKKSWQGKQCEPKTDGSDDLKLFSNRLKCVGELMRDPDAGGEGESDRVFRVRERCREYAKNRDGEDVTRRFRRNRSRNGGGFLGTVRISEREYRGDLRRR